MTVISNISDSMQRFAEVTKAAIKLDIDIFDDQLIRVAGTGKSSGKVGDKIQEKGIVNRHIYQGVDRIIIEHPGVEEKCKDCGNYGNCSYKKAVYAAIKHNGKTIGAMGILAFDDAQAFNLEENKYNMLAFVDQIAELIGNKVKDHVLASTLRHEISGGVNTIRLNDIIGRDQSIEVFKEKIKRIAGGRSTVLLVGETGTGKELFSRAIHSESKRADKPFIAINCGAIPENLIESELFGYEKGAFTGANKYGKHGKFFNANGGTILLDEVENMPIYMQQKLLRVLETKEVERIGSSEPISIDVRIIVASNRNLEAMVTSGQFREDLFHRLNVITLDIPPLRERGDDALMLARHFIDKYNDILGVEIHGLSDDVAQFMRGYDWPGNVRELQNTIEYAMNMETTGYIHIENLPERLKNKENLSMLINSDATLETLEKESIRKGLEKYGWTDEGKIQVANLLGVSRSTVYRKIRKFGLKKQI